MKGKKNEKHWYVSCAEIVSRGNLNMQNCEINSLDLDPRSWRDLTMYHGVLYFMADSASFMAHYTWGLKILKLPIHAQEMEIIMQNYANINTTLKTQCYAIRNGKMIEKRNKPLAGLELWTLQKIQNHLTAVGIEPESATAYANDLEIINTYANHLKNN